MELACAFIFVLGWLGMAAYMNYKIWLKPDDIWRVQQEEQSRAPGRNPTWFRRFLHLDPLGLERSRARFIWFERAVAAVVLLVGLLLLVGVLGQVGR